MGYIVYQPGVTNSQGSEVIFGAGETPDAARADVKNWVNSDEDTGGFQCIQADDALVAAVLEGGGEVEWSRNGDGVAVLAEAPAPRM